MEVKKTSSLEETWSVAEDFLKLLKAGEVVGLVGDLGAGKTAFVQGIVKAMGADVQAKSPTFTFVREYSVDFEGIKKVVHADFYRLEDAKGVEALAMHDLMGDDVVMFVEWVNKVEEHGVKPDWIVEISGRDEGEREIGIRRVEIVESV